MLSLRTKRRSSKGSEVLELMRCKHTIQTISDQNKVKMHMQTQTWHPHSNRLPDGQVKVPRIMTKAAEKMVEIREREKRDPLLLLRDNKYHILCTTTR